MESQSDNGFQSIKKVDPYLKTLCLKMLEFNPHLRWSAMECLKSPYFDDIRIAQLEERSKLKIGLEIEDLSLNALLHYIKAESRKFNSHKKDKMEQPPK